MREASDKGSHLEREVPKFKVEGAGVLRLVRRIYLLSAGCGVTT
ncbi:MAG: hypothetical protein ACTS8R_01505 [Arsenophonus sp. NC-QC1-MAG3]